MGNCTSLQAEEEIECKILKRLTRRTARQTAKYSNHNREELIDVLPPGRSRDLGRSSSAFQRVMRDNDGGGGCLKWLLNTPLCKSDFCSMCSNSMHARGQQKIQFSQAVLRTKAAIARGCNTFFLSSAGPPRTLLFRARYPFRVCRNYLSAVCMIYCNVLDGPGN